MRQTILLTLVVLSLAPAALAKPSQGDVFKSIQDNVNQSDGSNGPLLPWICGGLGVILILAIVGTRQSRQAVPRTTNNPARLMREVMNSIPIKPRELKQLKVVAEEMADPEAQTPPNALVLLLCPSLLTKTVQNKSTRADTKTLKVVLKKMGIR
jgi:hypothetical protein